MSYTAYILRFFMANETQNRRRVAFGTAVAFLAGARPKAI